MPELYIKYEGDTPVAYAYGEEWVAMALFMDDIGYQTEEEAVLAWYREQEALRESALSSVKRQISGGWGFGGDNSAPIEAAALALWGAKTAKRDPNKVMRIG